MKTINLLILSLVLGLFASSASAVLRPPFPVKPSSPSGDEVILLKPKAKL